MHSRRHGGIYTGPSRGPPPSTIYITGRYFASRDESNHQSGIDGIRQLVTAGSEDKSTEEMLVEMYGWPDDATLLNYYQLLKNMSAPDAPPPLRMTEISTFKYAVGLHEKYDWIGSKMTGSRFDPTFDSTLDIARFIWQWLALINAEFLDWRTAVRNMKSCSPNSTATCAMMPDDAARYSDGLIHVSPSYATIKNSGFDLTKRFWMFRHFTKFI